MPHKNYRNGPGGLRDAAADIVVILNAGDKRKPKRSSAGKKKPKKK